MVELLLFAVVIWCLLEYRCDQRLCWLDRAALVCGLALANSWAIAGFMPLFVVALTLFSFLAQPGTNAFSRRLEHDSDTFGLELTHANDAAARTFMKLGSQNRSNPEPSPFVEFFEYSHPPLLERVRFAQSYRPWAEGKPNRLYRPGR